MGLPKGVGKDATFGPRLTTLLQGCHVFTLAHTIFYRLTSSGFALTLLSFPGAILACGRRLGFSEVKRWSLEDFFKLCLSIVPEVVNKYAFSCDSGIYLFFRCGR